MWLDYCSVFWRASELIPLNAPEHTERKKLHNTATFPVIELPAADWMKSAVALNLQVGEPLTQLRLKRNVHIQTNSPNKCSSTDSPQAAGRLADVGENGYTCACVRCCVGESDYVKGHGLLAPWRRRKVITILIPCKSTLVIPMLYVPSSGTNNLKKERMWGGRGADSESWWSSSKRCTQWF